VPEIQGSGPAAAVTGPVATEGVVVGDFEGRSPNLRGFYLQDPQGDDDPATSDGIFVFNGNEDEVEVGQHVRVVGGATDYQDQTQIGANTDGVTVCEAQPAELPEPTELTLPLDESERERYEGMLVVLPQQLAVTETYLLGRFGQVTMSAEAPYTPESLGGRLPQPTNLVEPGPASQAVQAENDRHRILFDDATNRQNPDPIVFSRDETELTADNTLRGGDTATGTVGVLTYTWGGDRASGNAYRVRPIGALDGNLDFVPANPRTEQPEDVGGSLTAASFNVLNYFNTFTGCRGGVAGESMDCRGADNAFELERQADKIVAALAGLDADVVGLVEIENDGYGADSAIADLVRRLNDVVGAGTYRYLDVDERSAQVDALGDDAIKVGLIYKHGEVVPNGETAVLNTESFVNGGTDSPKNRPALAQAFRDRDTGGRFTMVVNHLKSKGSGCGAGNDDPQQGSCNATRVRAAQELADWLATYPTGIKEPDILLMGDLNSYAKEDPIDTLLEAGFTNLVQEFEGDGAYSYVFDGQWGYLDHALASPSMVDQVIGTTTWHINADEPPVLDYNTNYKSQEQVESLYAPTPYRSSDHDPVLVGLELTR
jgi:predicted extracellular nuclease